MKTRFFQLVIAAILLCGAAVFTSCTKEDNPATPDLNVRLTQKHLITYANGALFFSGTEDYLWKDGLLRSINVSTTMYTTGNTSGSTNTYVYDDNGNCIEEHHFSEGSTSLKSDAYFVYDEQGRMTSAVEKNAKGEINQKVTITGYTDDGHIQALTEENFLLDYVVEHQLTWKDGDMIGFSSHYLTPGQKDRNVTIEYDDYPNYSTGMPLASNVFDPLYIAFNASVHNLYAQGQEFYYANGRVVKAELVEDNLQIISYFTYSDGTTGKVK
jgi:YD repeat-containing protein